MVVGLGGAYRGNGWRGGITEGGIFQKDVVKNNKKYIQGELDGGTVGARLSDENIVSYYAAQASKETSKKLQHAAELQPAGLPPLLTR